MSDNQTVPSDSRAQEYPMYAFHDPVFMEWWLGSLYLLPAVDQIAVAEILDQSIHTPKVKVVLDTFIRGIDGGPVGSQESEDDGQVDVPPAFEGTLAERSIQFAKYHAVAYWKSNPWMVLIAGSGLVFAVGRGIWFVGKEFFRIVF